MPEPLLTDRRKNGDAKPGALSFSSIVPDRRVTIDFSMRDPKPAKMIPSVLFGPARSAVGSTV
jgi:hypothetical protein